MFKLSLAFSATTLVSAAVVVDTITYCTELKASCPLLTPANCGTAFSGYNDATLLGSDTDTKMNTIGCRLRFLQAPGFNATTDCRYAGPSGGGRCGAVLDSTCKIASTICGVNGSYIDGNSCLTGLSPVQHFWGSKQGAAAATDNSLECRLYHSIASQADPLGGHCSHWNLTGSPCVNALTPDATHYCNTLQFNCLDSKNATAQFANIAQCKIVANGFPSGANTVADSGANSLGCREYHAQAALASTTHCSHAGPSGGTICGSFREAWGSILNAAPCNDPHVNSFLGSFSNKTVLDGLVPVGSNSSAAYSVILDTGMNTQACRIYHLGVASTDITHCAHGAVSGGGACGGSIDNLCNFIGGVCGFGGNSTYQFPTLAACKTDLTALGQGAIKPQDKSNNTVECRFYHATVAASYSVGGVSAAEAGAMNQMVAHCSHVLKTTPAGGCGYVAPAPSASVPTTAGAPAISSLVSLLIVAGSMFSF